MKHQKPHTSPSERRPGAVLLVVITLMGLFTAVGLSFVYYAEAEATASKLFRESTDLSSPNSEAELALSYFLGKLIYGERDDDMSGIYNAGRGHDLARSAYGFNYTIMPIGPNGAPMLVMLSPQRAYTGTGRLHYLYPPGTALAGVDNYGLPNYQYWATDGFLRDPERVYLNAGVPSFRPNAMVSPTTGVFAGGFNAPYTYPDLNSFYLAAVRADGTVLTPSFHREYLFGRLDDSTNPNWTNAIGKYLTLRPRPADHPGFPYPEDRGGDVRNLPQGLGFLGMGYNDSIWIDFGAPVMTSEDGRKYKMLFAPLIIDLDGRINLNVHGNIRNLINNNAVPHAGNQGLGRWEANLFYGATYPGAGIPSILPNTTEGVQLFSGRTNPPLAGRYGTSNGPHIASPPPGTTVDQWAFQLMQPPTGRWYSPIDLDGINSGLLQMPGVTVGTYTVPPYAAFPNCPPGPPSYENSDQLELINSPANQILHPGLFQYYYPFAGDRRFSITSMEGILRYGDKGSPAIAPDLFRLIPQNLSQPRVRGLVTTHNYDLNRPSLTPWVLNPGVVTPYYPTPSYYQMDSPVSGAFPTGAPIPFPPLTQLGTATGEFNANLQAIATTLNRLDLNTPLPDYPLANPATGLIDLTNAANQSAYTAALTKRQNLAARIYKVLLAVTGGRDPNTPVPMGGNAVTAAEINAARWLAQLAVNIVDYIDNDDYMTPFVWYTNPNANGGMPTETVYGTELPRLVLNETYAQLDNDTNNDQGVIGMTKAGFYQLNIWVELLNTFRSTPPGNAYLPATSVWPRDGGSAILQNTNNAVYRLDVCQPGAIAQLTTQPTNATGDPNFNTPNNGNFYSTNTSVTNWGVAPNQLVVLPDNDAYAGVPSGNQGFYVIGPQFGAAAPLPNPLPGASTNLLTTSTSPSLSIKVMPNATDVLPANPTLVLRRLACPHLPPNDPNANYNPNGAAFDSSKPLNPYITVDYTENIPINDGRLFNTVGQVANLPVVTNFSSVGRNQPYAGNTNFLIAQNPNPAPAMQPKNTFFRHNAVEGVAPPNASTKGQTLQIPFDWLVQMDRPLISPMELLHVSAYRPHLLTHQFITGTPATPVKFQHYAQWFNSATRLSRFFEYAGTHDFALGMAFPARVPGKININTIWDPEVLAALCNHPQALAIYNNLMASRTPTPAGMTVPAVGPTNLHQPTAITIGPAASPTTYPVNLPFLSLGAGSTTAITPPTVAGGQYPLGISVNNTILRPVTGIGGNPTDARLFDVTTNAAGTTVTHPYQQHDVLTKLFNNVTTRSNVFAVFVTVGFFQVTDDTTRPVKLGPEIGRAENRHVRHRFFAIVDRSDLRRINGGITPVNGNSIVAGTQDQLTVTVPGAIPNPQNLLILNSLAGNAFVVSVGDEIVIEPNTPNEEVVGITQITHPDANTWQCLFTARRTHVMNGTIPIPAVFRGNPGPWANYNPRYDPLVVRYFSVID